MKHLFSLFMLLHLTWRSVAFPAPRMRVVSGWCRRWSSFAVQLAGDSPRLLPRAPPPPSKERRRAGTSGRVGATGFAKVHLEPRPEWLLSPPELPLNASHARVEAGFKTAHGQPHPHRRPQPAPPTGVFAHVRFRFWLEARGRANKEPLQLVCST